MGAKSMMSGQCLARLRNQQGMALILSILILVAAAVVALSLGLDTTLETRIAGNQKTTEQAFLNAEAGLAQARITLTQKFTQMVQNNPGIIGSGGQPNWSLLIPSPLPSPSQKDDPDIKDNEFRVEDKITANNQTLYKVYAHDPGYAAAAGEILTLRSIGFAPGGARQVVEENIEAQASGTGVNDYAQQGGGATKANNNLRDTQGLTSIDPVATGATLR